MNYRYKKRSSFSYTTKFYLFITGVVLVLIFLFGILPVMHTNDYAKLTVIDKSYSGESDGYIVWFEDEDGTQYEFQNEDSILRGKFNSGTVQGKLKEGNKYNITTAGWRIPIFSMYPNIIDYELVEDKE